MRGRAAPPHPGIYWVPPPPGLVTLLMKSRQARNVWKETPTTDTALQVFIITFYWKFSCLFSKLQRSLSEFFPLFDFTEIVIAWPSTFSQHSALNKAYCAVRQNFVLTALSSVEPLQFTAECPEEEAVLWQYQQSWEHFFVVCFLDEN